MSIFSGQVTFDDIERSRVVTSLNKKEKRIVALLDEGCTQGTIAKRMHISRSAVSATVRKLESNNLLKKQFPSNYNNFYELSPDLKTRYKNKPEAQISSCRVHHIRRKYKITFQSHVVSKDKRTGFQKSWEMRGSTWYKFWYPGKAGELAIQVDVHPRSLTVYPDAHQNIPAESIEEAEDRTRIALHNAVNYFIQQQELFGVKINIDEIGKQITPTHYGYLMAADNPLAASGTAQPDACVDGSPQDLGEPGYVEYETVSKVKATKLDQAIDRVLAVDDIVRDGIAAAMPEAMREFEKSLGPLTSEIHAVVAHMQSSQPIQHQINQLTVLFGKMLEKQHSLEDMLSKPVAVAVTGSGLNGYSPTYED